MQIRIRNINKNDCYDIWLWRNHPDIRKRCFSNGVIDYEKHKKWFDNKLHDKKVIMYIADNQNNEKLAQIRFQMYSKHSAYIHVNLNPCFLGMSLGSIIIRQASELFMQDNPDIKDILAEIFYNNIASLKAFQKAGYKFVKKSFKDKKQIKTFIFKPVNDAV